MAHRGSQTPSQQGLEAGSSQESRRPGKARLGPHLCLRCLPGLMGLEKARPPSLGLGAY